MTRKKKDVNITSVTFRSSIPGEKQFQHLHVEATAGVDENEDPQEVLDKLKTFVGKELTRARFGEIPKPVQRQGRFQLE